MRIDLRPCPRVRHLQTMCRSGGDHQFEWTSIEEADNCLLVLNDISGAGPETSQNNFETYVAVLERRAIDRLPIAGNE